LAALMNNRLDEFSYSDSLIWVSSEYHDIFGLF